MTLQLISVPQFGCTKVCPFFKNSLPLFGVFCHQCRPSAHKPAHFAPLPSCYRLPQVVLPCTARRQKQPSRRPLETNAITNDLLGALQQPPIRDVAATLFAVTGAVALVKLFDMLEARGVIDKKLSRKLVHILAGPLFVLSWPLFSDAEAARYCAALVPGLNAMRLLAVGSGVVSDQDTVQAVSREGDCRELLRGPLYYVLVLIAVTVFFWRGSPVGVAALALMCGGDGAADIAGRRWGQNNPLPYNPTKSWAGSTAMFVGGFLMSALLVLLLGQLGYYECSPAVLLPTLAAVSAAATITESLPINGSVDDNLSVPGVSLLLAMLLTRAAVL